MNVLHLIDSAGMYGAEVVVLTLLRELRNSDVIATLGCIREDEEDEVEVGRRAEDEGITVVYFTMKRGLNLCGIWKILSFIKRNKIDIVHSHGYKPNIFLGILPKPVLGIPVVSTIHGWSKESAGLKGRMYEYLDTRFLRRFDAIVAVSDKVVGDMENAGIPINEKVHVIKNGIWIKDDRSEIVQPKSLTLTLSPEGRGKGEGSNLRKRFKIPEKVFLIGTVGRLSREKGHRFLIEAIPAVLKQIPDLHCVIAGDGYLLKDLQDRCRSLDIVQHVHFIGFCKDISDLLYNIDIFVLPSLTEGLPVSMLEAMLMQRAVIASAVGGIPEVIKDNVNGLFVEPENSREIAEKVFSLYSDRERRESMGENASQTVKEEYSSLQMKERYLDMYDRVGELGS